jgi:hypothetical protein
MHADDNRDRNRNPEPEAALASSIERDQAAFDSQYNSEEPAGTLSLGRSDRIVNGGDFSGGQKSHDAGEVVGLVLLAIRLAVRGVL